MKKFLSCILTIGLAFCLVGCGEEKASSGKAKKISADEAKALFNTANKKINTDGSNFSAKTSSESIVTTEGKINFDGIEENMASFSKCVETGECAGASDLFYSKNTVSSTVTSSGSTDPMLSSTTMECYVDSTKSTNDLYTKISSADYDLPWSCTQVTEIEVEEQTTSFISFDEMIGDWSYFVKEGNLIRITDEKAINVASLTDDQNDILDGSSFSISIKSFEISFDDNGAFSEVNIDFTVTSTIDYSKGSLGTLGATGILKTTISSKMKLEFYDFGSTTLVIPDAVKSAKAA